LNQPFDVVTSIDDGDVADTVSDDGDADAVSADDEVTSRGGLDISSWGGRFSSVLTGDEPTHKPANWRRTETVFVTIKLRRKTDKPYAKSDLRVNQP
jgi:hypothetical protein